MSVLEVRDLVVSYGAGRHALVAVDHVSIEVNPSTIVGLVGESGSGKSTLGKAVVGLVPVRSGEILLAGHRQTAKRLFGGYRASSKQRRRIQYVFQDPYASLDPRMSVGASIAEGLVAAGRHTTRAERAAELHRLLGLVRLDPQVARLRPRQLSGGQRQRVAIARALAARPSILIADEITSSLDVSVQGAVLNLLREIQAETGVGVLFISHNLAVVRYLAEDVYVMHSGKLVESGPVERVIEHPRAAYTKQLIAAVPSIPTARA
jgi:peptide/nickel transport system ATP-binding protein